MTRQGTASLSPAAAYDLDSIASDIQASNEDAARRFLKAARHAFDLLAKFPYLGENYSHSLYPDLRIWSLGGRFKRYAVFYRPISSGIEVVRVLHTSRDFRSALHEGR